MPYAPAGMRSVDAGQRHYPAAYYKRQQLDQLMKKFVFMSVTEPDEIPQRNGKIIQWYRLDLPVANTVDGPEGTVGNSLSYTTSTIQATVKEYSDFITASQLLIETDISPTVENMNSWLGYRAGLSVDVIVRTELDSAYSSVVLSTNGPYLAAIDFLEARALLRGADVPGRSQTDTQGEEFVAVAHPYVLFDMQSDNTVGGYIDVKKYAAPNDILNAEVGKAGGCRIIESTNVGTNTALGNTTYNVYVVGAGCIGAVDLAGKGPSNVRNPKRQAFKTNVIMGKPSMTDPEGKIGAAVSYRFVFVAKLLDGTSVATGATGTYRYKILEADPSIV